MRVMYLGPEGELVLREAVGVVIDDHDMGVDVRPVVSVDFAHGSDTTFTLHDSWTGSEAKKWLYEWASFDGVLPLIELQREISKAHY